jgi:ribosomal protein S18 acetylase RimI-like enzyme
MEQIITKRFTMTIANKNNLPELEEIEKECDNYFTFDPPCASEHNRSIRECLAIGDIIPGIEDENYSNENYKLYCIWQSDILIGFLSLYLEYKQDDTAYLSVLYIKEAYRQRGIGIEIIEALFLTLKTARYKIIRTHCSLRNATALRFWVKNGFSHIVDIECDGNLYPENFGGIELMKFL